MSSEPTRRPGGGVRLLLLLATLAGFFEVFSRGFPPAARARLPILVVALGLALLAAWRPQRGLLVFSFLFPLAGLGDRVFGGADAIAWPVLLFTGFAAGWTFRFLYDFESGPDPSRVDATLRALAAVWLLATLYAVVRARTLWALLHGLKLRAVNGEGLLDAAAIRDSLLSFAALAVGVAYFFLLRRSGRALRRRALAAALTGVGVSAAVAVAERLGMPPGETSDFWKMTGRLSGGAVDPNALGVLCGLAMAPALAMFFFERERRLFAAALAIVLSAGLLLAGSRSGLVVAGVGLLVVILGSRGPKRLRPVLALLGLALIAAIGLFLLRGARGSVGSRLSEVFDPRLTAEYRASARPLLWRGAVRLFERHPATGAGLGAFSWHLPDLLAEEGRSLPVRDNPGNGYLQALAETGAIGFLLTMAFALGLVLPRSKNADGGESGPSALGTGGRAAITGFLLALLAGSHWFAPDVALLFFLFAAAVAPGARASPVHGMDRRVWILVAAYAAAASGSALATLDPDETFRHRNGVGFHARENGSAGPFYWTQRRFAIRVLPKESLRLALAHFTPENRSLELTAESGGQAVLRRTLQPGEILPLRISGGASSPRVVRFSVSRSFVPKRLGLSSDRRQLGVVAVFPPEKQ
ncbi:MAG TPA: O-antigen ligase family protein [Thermoanaerobaculia bacterium]